MTPRPAVPLAGVCPVLALAQPVLGTPPRHAAPTLAEVPNAQAIDQRIWAPGIDAGYVPQGVAWAGGRLYLSAYRSTDPGAVVGVRSRIAALAALGRALPGAVSHRPGPPSLMPNRPDAGDVFPHPKEGYPGLTGYSDFRNQGGRIASDV